MNKADLVILSKSIFTGENDSLLQGGIAITGNKITAVGSNSRIAAFIGESTKVCKYDDLLVMPGIMDAHVHLTMGAIVNSCEHTCTEITDSKSEEECVEMVKAFAENHPELHRIRGMGWFPINWRSNSLPSKKSLDAAFPDKPVFLICADGHTHWLNSKALEECGISKASTCRFGEIGKDADGELNGLLFEMDACGPSLDKFLDLPVCDTKKIMKEFLAEISEFGITSICDMAVLPVPSRNYNAFKSLGEIENEGDLTARIYLYPSLGIDGDFTAVNELRKTYNSEKLKVAGLKQFIDGVTTTYTGYLLDPYEDNPDTCGKSNFPADTYRKCAVKANGLGFPVRFHGLGDAAVRMCFNIFEESNKLNKNYSMKNSIEHCENVHPDDICRFAKTNTVASMQPYHLPLDANEKIARIGEERCKFEWPHKSILDANGILAFGTDYPVVHFNPFPNIYAAVTRCDEDGIPTGANDWEKISLADALRAYTYGAACSHNVQDKVGTIKEGMMADIIVLDRNPFAASNKEIKDTKVILTVSDGRIVFERKQRR